MKSNLIFNLPEENRDLQDALDGWKWRAIVEDFLHYLNKTEQKLTYDNIRLKIISLIEERGVSLD